MSGGEEFQSHQHQYQGKGNDIHVLSYANTWELEAGTQIDICSLLGALQSAVDEAAHMSISR